LVLLGLLLGVASVDILRGESSAQDAVLEAYFAHAASARQRGQPRRVRIFLQRAIARAPGDARGVLQLGAIVLPTELPRAPLSPEQLRDVARLREAIVVALGPPAVQDAETARRLRRMDAWAAAVHGQLDTAIEAASRACGRLDDETALMLRRLSRAAVEQQQLLQADRALEGARRCAAASVEAVWELGIVRLARGRTAEAVALLREVVQRKPGDLHALRDLAGALLASGDAADALRLYADVAAQCPREARCELDLARAALEARAYDQALAACARARTIAVANDPEPSLVLAAIHLGRNARREAIDAFRDALQRAPGNARAAEGLRNLESAPATGESANPR
jgi:tetratricopeptide (TPR) repeat protein